MRHLIYFLFFGAFLFFLSACKKPPIYDDTPAIAWVGFSSDTVQQLSGAVDVTFSFTDGDGDLGQDGDTANHILLIDTRRTPNDVLPYKIPTINRENSLGNGIAGEITISLAQLCGISRTNPSILCQPQPDYYDPVVYEIRIKDNAGRWSNTILSDTLYIKCFE
jgi:hypothetical protein